MSHPKPEHHPDEISLFEFLSSIANILRWAKSNFKWLSLSILIFSGGIFLWTVSRPQTYTAELTFMLNDDNNPQISSVGGILGQLGLPIPSGKYNVDKLLEIAKSRKILENALFEKVQIAGKETFIANHFIEIYQLRSSWQKKDDFYKTFSFTQSETSLFSNRENYALKALYQKIIGSEQNRNHALFSTDYGRLDYIMSFVTTTLSPELSIAFTNAMYNQVSSFYIEKAIEKNQMIYDIIEIKRDSLANLVQETSLEIARIKDRNSGTFRSVNNVDVANLTAYLTGLETAYQEVEKSLNNADIALQSGTPLIQLLDQPIPPLSPDGKSLIKRIILGAIIGAIFFVLIQLFGQIYSLSKNAYS